MNLTPWATVRLTLTRLNRTAPSTLLEVGLVTERYVLPEHVKTIVEEAGQHWDWMVAQTTASSQR